MLKKILNWFKTEAQNYSEANKVPDFPVVKTKPALKKATTRSKEMPLKKSTSKKARQNWKIKQKQSYSYML